MFVDSPVGTSAERATGKVWPGQWQDATGFGINTIAGYSDGYHTGADLNLNFPNWDMDKGAPVYTAASGTVLWSRNYMKSWGWIIVIHHVDDTGKNFYTRYAHLNHIDFPVISEGAVVTVGQVIGHIGNADGYYKDADHLHFDISLTDILATAPDHWPGTQKDSATLADLTLNYVNPRDFILAHHGTKTVDTHKEEMRVITDSLLIRPEPNKSKLAVGALKGDDVVAVTGSTASDGYHFAQLLEVNGQAQNGPAYVAREFLAKV